MTASPLTAPPAPATSSSRPFETEAMSLGANTYLTYPHCNLWGRDGRSFVFGRIADEAQGGVQLVWKESVEGRETVLPALKRLNPKALYWYDVARETNQIVNTADNGVWILDSGASDWRQIYQAPEGATVQNLPSIRADGTHMIIGQAAPDASLYACVEIDTRSGESKTLFEQSWRANHFHYCPHDESWIGFSHEEWPEWKAGLPTIGDRMWAWHAEHAPQGKFLFGGKQEDGTNINTGHERWGYTDTSALTVVYRTSTFEPRGVWEVWAKGHKPKLISALRNFLHVDGSRDGKWAVADTAGVFDPAEAPIPGDEGSRSDVVLIEKATGKTRLLARSHLTAHPYHVHPIISPDNEWVLYNDSASPLEDGLPGSVMVRTGVTS